MKRLVLILFLVSICYGTPFYLLEVRGDTFTSHLKPITDSTLDIGTTELHWRFIWSDIFTDGTALWESSNLSGFNSIYGTIITGETLTDGTFVVSGGVISTGIWNGTAIDISDYTNLVAGTNLTLLDDTLNVDDAFLTGSVETDILIVDTDTLIANITGYVDKVGIGTVTPSDTGWAILQIEGADSAAGGPHIVFETDADTYPLMQFINYAHDNMSITFDAYYDGAHKSSDAGSNARIQKLTDKLLFRYDSGVAQGGAVTWNDAISIDLTDGAVTTDIFMVGSNPPLTSASAGTAGTITYDANYIYVAIANNSWKRAALSSWAITDVLLLDDGASKLLLDDGASFLLIRL